MGTYINPPRSKYPLKEAWIIKHMTIIGDLHEVSKEEFKELNYNVLDASGKISLCFIDNVVFTALLVCDTPEELSYLQRQIDKEERRCWYLVGDKEACLKYAS